MLPILYLLYLSIIAVVLVRARSTLERRGSPSEWGALAVEIMVLPLAIALVLMVISARSESTELIVGLPLVPGVALLALGFLASQFARTVALQLRIAGWSLIAGFVLVPSSLVLLAPVVALAGFFLVHTPLTGPRSTG